MKKTRKPQQKPPLVPGATRTAPASETPPPPRSEPAVRPHLPKR